MMNIIFVRSKLSARLGADITDWHVVSYFDLDTLLMEAVPNGTIREIRYLLSVGADIHKNKDHAVRFAAANGRMRMVRFLVKRGADIQAGDNQAVQLASRMGNLNMVKYLVSKGANIHACNDCALRQAVEYNKLDVVKYLVSQGADTSVIEADKERHSHEMIEYFGSIGGVFTAQND